MQVDMNIPEKNEQRVAFFLYALGGGGAERVMLNLARGFVERGILLDLVVGKAQGPLVSEIPDGVRLVNLGATRLRRSLFRLIRYLRSEKPCALLSATTPVNLVALWAKHLSRSPVRVVIAIHNTFSQQVARDSRAGGRLMTLLAKWTFPRADAVVAVSRGAAEDFSRSIGFPEEKVRVIYNPVVLPSMFARAREPVEHPWFAPGEPPVILGVGRLTEQKDFGNLVRAFQAVRQEKQARLMILGEGEDRPEIEKLVHALGLQEDVCMPGFVDNPYKYLASCDLFVLSSRWEGLPTVLIEALALGTPVVSTDCPSGPIEILENGRLGRLIPINTPDLLADAIVHSLGTAYDDREAKASTSRFTLDRVVGQYLASLGLRGPS